MNKVLALFSRWYLGVGLEQRDPHFLKLETLPELIVVTHSPNPASVQKDGRSGRGLTWEFATSVATKSDAIRILEFGALSKHYDQWDFRTQQAIRLLPESLRTGTIARAQYFNPESYTRIAETGSALTEAESERRFGILSAWIHPKHGSKEPHE